MIKVDIYPKTEEIEKEVATFFEDFQRELRDLVKKVFHIAEEGILISLMRCPFRVPDSREAGISIYIYGLTNLFSAEELVKELGHLWVNGFLDLILTCAVRVSVDQSSLWYDIEETTGEARWRLEKEVTISVDVKKGVWGLQELSTELLETFKVAVKKELLRLGLPSIISKGCLATDAFLNPNEDTVVEISIEVREFLQPYLENMIEALKIAWKEFAQKHNLPSEKVSFYSIVNRSFSTFF